MKSRGWRPVRSTMLLRREVAHDPDNLQPTPGFSVPTAHGTKTTTKNVIVAHETFHKRPVYDDRCCRSVAIDDVEPPARQQRNVKDIEEIDIYPG